MTSPASVAPGNAPRDGAPRPTLLAARPSQENQALLESATVRTLSSKGSEAAPIHRVMIEYPGYEFHHKIGRLTGAFEDDFLGMLFCVEVEGCAIGLTKDCLRLLEPTP
jgi:hypothetical protein